MAEEYQPGVNAKDDVQWAITFVKEEVEIACATGGDELFSRQMRRLEATMCLLAQEAGYQAHSASNSSPKQQFEKGRKITNVELASLACAVSARASSWANACLIPPEKINAQVPQDATQRFVGMLRQFANQIEQHQ